MKKNDKPPAHLGPEAAQFWSNMLHEYQLDDTAGRALLATACECLMRMREAQAHIEKHGAVLRTENGHKANPSCKIELDSRNGLLACLRGLNLDIEPLRAKPGRPAGTFKLAK